jgi:transcriptional regulator with XRE-family HTH domain
MTEKNEFGNTIKGLRIESGMTQSELAEMIGVDHTYISKIENGTSKPPSKRVLKKLAALGPFSAEWLAVLSGAIDTKRLQKVARENPSAAAALIALEKAELSDIDWQRIERIASDC